MQARSARVKEDIITFVETFEDLLSSSDDEIDAFFLKFTVAIVQEPPTPNS